MSIAEWTDLMPHRVTVAPYVSQDGYGNPTYGDAVEYSARIVGKLKWLRTDAGVELVSRWHAYIGASSHFSVRDQITVSTDYDVTQPPIIAIERVADEFGTHHSVLYC